MTALLYGSKPHQQDTVHVLALPYLGRGHIHPMLCLCDLLLSKQPGIRITFLVTEKWLRLISSDQIYRPNSDIQFTTIPTAIPPELDRARDVGSSVVTAMLIEGPFLQLLDGLEQPPTLILADTFMTWASEVGNRRNIPVVSVWTQSASVFSILYHLDLLKRHGHYPMNLLDHGDEQVDYIPGVSPTKVADLPAYLMGNADNFFDIALECIIMASKSQCLLLTSFYELEPLTIKALRNKMCIPIYSVGPAIPFQKLHFNEEAENYLTWLDAQPPRSVLYISLGSYLSVSNNQLEEMIAGLQGSGINFLWVARGKIASLITNANSKKSHGLVVPWCNQLKVLCHNSVGGFWTHCGWNSTLEAIFSGVPILAFPAFVDQTHNSKQITEDWKIGFRAKAIPGRGELITREEIMKLIGNLMDRKSKEGEEVSKRVKELQHCCLKAIANTGGSSATNIDAFISDVLFQTKAQTIPQQKSCRL